jgi:hypothetical protein
MQSHKRDRERTRGNRGGKGSRRGEGGRMAKSYTQRNAERARGREEMGKKGKREESFLRLSCTSRLQVS